MSAWACTPPPTSDGAWVHVESSQDEDAAAVATLEARLAARRDAVRKCDAPEPVGAEIAAAIQRKQEEAEQQANMALDEGEAVDEGDEHPFIVPDFGVNEVDDGVGVEFEMVVEEETAGGFDFMQ